MRPDELVAAIALLFGLVVAALLAVLDYRRKQLEIFQNKAAAAKREAAHAEAELAAARDSDDELDAALRAALVDDPGKG